jgi:hypothetical protein
LEDWLKDCCTNSIRSQGAKVGRPLVTSEVIGDVVSIRHPLHRLRKLDVIGHSKDRAHGIGVHRNEGCEIQSTLDTHEPHVLLPTIHQGPVDHRQKDLGVIGSGGIIHPIALRVVEGQNRKVSKIHPMLKEVTVPITKDTFDGQARVKLQAESVDNQSEIGRKVLEAALFTWKACARSYTGIKGVIFGYNLTFIRPTETSTGSRGAKPISWTSRESWGVAIFGKKRRRKGL